MQEIRTTGLDIIPGSDHDDKYGNFNYESPTEMKFDDIDLVVMGYDDRINYFKFAFAFYALQCGVTYPHQADLVSTNADRNTNSYAFPSMKTLGNGSFVAAIESASGKKAFVAGKPNADIFDIISGVHHVAFYHSDQERRVPLHRRQPSHRHYVRQPSRSRLTARAHWSDRGG